MIILIIIIVILVLYLYFNDSIFEFFEGEWHDKIDGIVYINLENRDDRKKLILDELKKINTNMTKVNKVSGIYTPKNGHKGCVQSHILALNIAIMNNWKYTLIFEDDMELDVSPDIFNKNITCAMDYLNDNNIDWDVIMLATANAKKTPINSYLSKITRANTSSGYIVNNNYYIKLLNLFKNCNTYMSKDKWSVSEYNEPYALDQQWLSLQKVDNWYAFNNDLIKQRNIHSTIMLRK